MGTTYIVVVVVVVVIGLYMYNKWFPKFMTLPRPSGASFGSKGRGTEEQQTFCPHFATRKLRRVL